MRKKKSKTIIEKFYFKKWSRNKYSILKSLKSVVKIAVLSVGYLLNSFTGTAQTDTLNLDEIKVKAARTELKYSDATRMLSIIEKDEIEAMPASSISNILSSALNVDVRERGQGSMQADISMRGGSFEETLILINGMRLNDSQTGHFSLNLPIDPDDIKHIEILNGPSARIYGNNAFSGAINIITGKSNNNFLKFSGTGGSFGYWDTKISGNYKIKNFHNYLSVSKSASQGYKENTDFNITNAYYSAYQTFSNSSLNIQAGYTDKAFGANSFYTPVYPNQYEENKTAFANIRYRTDAKIRMTYAAYWRTNYDKFELFRNNPANWYQGANYHINNSYGASINSNFNILKGNATLGTEWYYESIISNKLGDSLKSPKYIKGSDNKYFTNGSQRQNISFFAEQQYNLKKINIVTGIMGNYNTVFGWNFYPGIDLGYGINKHLKLTASANMSGRLPSFTDLYYVGPSNIGNPNLTAEKAFTYEGGLKYTNSFIVIQTALFKRLGSNIIDWVKQNPNDLWQPQNFTDVNATGFEFATKIVLNKIQNNHLPINYIRINYAYTETNKLSDAYSKYALDYLKHNFSISIENNIYKNIKAAWKFQYRKRNGSYIPYDAAQHIWLNKEEYKDIYLIDLQIFYKNDKIKVFAQGLNLLDIKYQDIENVELSGRCIKAGVSFKIGL